MKRIIKRFASATVIIGVGCLAGVVTSTYAGGNHSHLDATQTQNHAIFGWGSGTDWSQY